MTPTETPLPADSLLARFAGARGAYADAYTLSVPRAVTGAEFVEAFFTTRLFRLERAILTLVGRPSSDADARAVARGETHRFAAWIVQARAGDELLLQDVTGATCSWFQAERGAGATTLWFGSAIVPRGRGPGGEPRMGWVFHALLGFHRRYSRALLKAAVRRLER